MSGTASIPNSVPYLEVRESIDSLDALMALDRELAERHAIFARRMLHFEWAEFGIPQQQTGRAITLILVIRIGPGLRIRRSLALFPAAEIEDAYEITIPTRSGDDYL